MSSELSKHPLILYRGWKEPGQYVWSPFVAKIELRLRYGGVAYKTEAGSARTAPKGKVPYLEFSADDKLGDSTLIIKRLVQDGIVEDFNGSLSSRDRALDLALRALLEDKLYFYHVCDLSPAQT
jgi:Glutathione S-transferase N-terminal domain